MLSYQKFTVFVLIEKLVFTIKRNLSYFASDHIYMKLFPLSMINHRRLQVQTFRNFIFKLACFMEKGSCKENRLKKI